MLNNVFQYGRFSFVTAPHKKNKKSDQNFDQTNVKNCPKVAIYARFVLKMGLGLKFPEKLGAVQLHSSHGDPFRDQTRFRKTMRFLAASKKLEKKQNATKN